MSFGELSRRSGEGVLWLSVVPSSSPSEYSEDDDSSEGEPAAPSKKSAVVVRTTEVADTRRLAGLGGARDDSKLALTTRSSRQDVVAGDAKTSSVGMRAW